MNVRCPSCDTLYRVDPEKVPDEGIKARCAECPAVIDVSRPDVLSIASPLSTIVTEI